jgi:hypothetical protein
MTKFLPSSRREPCPICEQTNGDCRTLDTGFILCHSYIDYDPAHPDYQWRKSDKSGVWGIFVQRSEQNPFSRDEWLAQKAERERQRREALEQHFKTALPVEDRDKAIRQLAAALKLSSRHRNDLKQRGLTDDMIEKGLFFSVSPHQAIPLNIPKNLPGVDWLGNRLAIRHDGIAFVAFDKNGQAIGFQIRLDGATDAKYRWAKGMASSHLSNGELPLSVAIPESITRPHLGFCEGIGAKPTLTAHRFGQRIIGAAGGNFVGSPEQIQDNLGDYSTDLAIDLYVDGGDVLNPSKLKAWERQVNFFQSLGYAVQFPWWGQVSKTSHDCDELTESELNSVRYLSPDDFFKLAKDYQAQARWRKSKQFTAQMILNQEHLDWKTFDDNAAYFIKSGLGTGKTTNLRDWIEDNRSWLQHNRILVLGTLNNLLRQGVAQIRGLELLHEKADHVCLSDPDYWLALCLDSLWRFKPEDFDNCVLVLDELMSVIKHLLYGKTAIKQQREQIIELFTQALKRARTIICLDGNLADWAVDYIHKLCPDKPIHTVHNQHIGQKSKIHFLEGVIDKKEVFRPNKYSPWVKNLLQAPVVALCSDNKTFLDGVEKLLKKQGKKGLNINRDTSNSKPVKEFLTKPDAYLSQQRIDYLLYSPTAQSGIDIPITDYFTHHFGFFFGILDVDNILQMIARIRDVQVDKWLWVKEFSTFASDDIYASDPLLIQSLLTQQLTFNANKTLSGEINAEQIIANVLNIWHSQQQSVHAHCALTIQGMWNYEKQHLRQCVKEQLTAAGYQITPYRLNHRIDKGDMGLKTAIQEVKDEYYQRVFEAPESSPNQPLDIDVDPCIQIKQQIFRLLPGVQYQSIWSPEFLKTLLKGQMGLYWQLHRFWMIQHSDVSLCRSKQKFKGIHDRLFTGEMLCSWLYRDEHALILALKESGILDLDPEQEYHNDSPEILTIIRRCQRLKLTLGRQGKTSNIQFVGRLLQKVGLKWRSRKVRGKDGKEGRYYRVDNSLLSNPMGEVILNCLESKYHSYLTGEVEVMDWSAPVLKTDDFTTENEVNLEVSNIEGFETSQIQSEQALEPETPDPEFLYEIDAQGVAEELVEFQSLAEDADFEDQVIPSLVKKTSAMDSVAAIDQFEGYQEGQRVWAWDWRNQEWFQGIIDAIGQGWLRVFGDMSSQWAYLERPCYLLPVDSSGYI